MESLEQKPILNVQQSLENIPTVSEVKKLILDEKYFAWAKEHLHPDAYKMIEQNYKTIDAYNYKYLSDGLMVSGYLWTPKEIKEKLPVVVWNRGSGGVIGSIAETEGGVYLDVPSQLAQQNVIVVASDYRGGIGSEGKDEWGGKDLDDVIRAKEIADQLPMSLAGKSIVVGKSRGGMMSYMLAAKEPWVKAVISLAGPTNLVQSLEERPEMVEILKEAFGASENELKKRSATEFYRDIPKNIPILIMHAADDVRVSVDQVRKLNDLLKENGNTVEYHEFQDGGHGFNNPGNPHAKEVSEIMNRFIKEQAKNNA
jgi:dipeptidyl aminopeptidase/acylaminoacyl peptidase